jgi:hypothetical protein
VRDDVAVVCNGGIDIVASTANGVGVDIDNIDDSPAATTVDVL